MKILKKFGLIGVAAVLLVALVMIPAVRAGVASVYINPGSVSAGDGFGFFSNDTDKSKQFGFYLPGMTTGNQILANIGGTQAAPTGFIGGLGGVPSTFTWTSPTVVTGEPLAINTSVQGNQTIKALTKSSAVTFVKITVPSGGYLSGTILYDLQATDATDFQSRTGILAFSAVNKTGAITCGVSTPSAATESVAVSTGTFTNAFTCADATGGIMNILANDVPSLTPTTNQIKYRVQLMGTGTVAPQ